MAIRTPIEWCDSTLNLQMGCDGCELWNPKADVKECYAGILHERYGGHSSGYPESFDKPKLFPDRLQEALKWRDLTGADRADKPWLNGLPRLVFVDDMGDTFTESLPIDWLAPHLPALAATPHIYILLTKRANRMSQFFNAYSVPKNFWLLVSVTSAANYNRITQLLEIPGDFVRGISYEPALGPIDLSVHSVTALWKRSLNWVIAGGMSGASARPSHPDWFRSPRDMCQSSGCAFFLKQWGEFGPFHSGPKSELGRGPLETGGGHKLVEINGYTMARYGKKAAGAELDGREWKEFPRPRG